MVTRIRTAPSPSHQHTTSTTRFFVYCSRQHRHKPKAYTTERTNASDRYFRGSGWLVLVFVAVFIGYCAAVIVFHRLI